MLTEHPVLDVLNDLRSRAGYRFALLRHTPWDASLFAGGDIDLLGDERSITGLIEALYELTVAGRCHARIRRSSRDKTRLTIYAPDFSRRIELDLWLNLWQIDGGRRCLRWDNVAHLVTGDGAFGRLPLDLEAAIYVQHLVAKNKGLSQPGVQRRLSFYASACREKGLADLSGWMYRTMSARKVEPELEQLTLKIVMHRCKRPIRSQNPLRTLARRFMRLRPVIQQRVIAFIGCDGVGKTSVMDAIVRDTRILLIVEKLLAKQLYRSTLPFRAAYKINKASIKIPSEAADEWLAPLAFSCARGSLRKQLEQRGDRPASVLILDRFLADFLYVGRKSDAARFTPLAWLCRGRGGQCPIVHFVVPFDVLSSRKQEITAIGQQRYDRAMLSFYTQPSRATDYLLYCNNGTVEQAVGPLSKHMTELFAGRQELIPQPPPLAAVGHG